jgi:hypothetical protein
VRPWLGWRLWLFLNKVLQLRVCARVLARSRARALARSRAQVSRAHSVVQATSVQALTGVCMFEQCGAALTSHIRIVMQTTAKLCNQPWIHNSHMIQFNQQPVPSRKQKGLRAQSPPPVLDVALLCMKLIDALFSLLSAQYRVQYSAQLARSHAARTHAHMHTCTHNAQHTQA